MTDQDHEEYLRKLDEHSHAARYDPLRDAVRHVLAMWDQEDNQEKNDLSEDFWAAMGVLRNVLEATKR